MIVSYKGIYNPQWIIRFCKMTCMNSFAQWETDWQKKFNVAKCRSMRVTRHLNDKQIQFDYSLHQQKLEHVQSAKYLGRAMTANLDWDQHISEIACKATKTIWHWFKQYFIEIQGRIQLPKSTIYTGKHFYLPKSIEKTHARRGLYALWITI